MGRLVPTDMYSVCMHALGGMVNGSSNCGEIFGWGIFCTTVHWNVNLTLVLWLGIRNEQTLRQIGCFTCPISILKSIFSSTEAVICMQIQHCNTCFPRDIDALPIITTRSTSNTPYHTRTKDQIPHGVYLRLPQRTLDPHRSISSVLLTGPAESTDQLAPANNGIWYHMHHLRHTEWTAWDERCLIKFVVLLIVFLLLSWYWGWVG